MRKKNKPEIRFQGNTNGWEQRKFGDVFEEYSEKGHPELPVLMIVQGGGTIRRDESDRNLQYDKASLSNYKMVNEGDFIVHLRSFEGGLEKATSTGIISPAYHTFHGKGTDSRYYYSYFRSPKFIDQDLKPHVYGIRDGRSIDIEGMKTIDIPWTNFEEQRAIGDYIDTFDNLITSHQCKYEKLVVLKKSMLQKMFPQRGCVVPEMRFTGFMDPWEKCKFNDVFAFMQNNSLSRAELSSDKGEIINVHYGDVLVKYGEILDIAVDEVSYLLDNSLLKKYQGSLLKNGDIIIADAAEDETVGKCSEIVGLTTENALSGLHTIPCRPTMKFAEGYLGYYLNSCTYHDQLLPLIQGTKISSISRAALQDTEILYPKSEIEQAQIGTYFRQLDKLINLYRQKIEKLKNVKAACMDKMFV